jgi:AP-3 complex subunit mu
MDLGKLADDASMTRVQLTVTLTLKHTTSSMHHEELEDIWPPNLSLHWKILLTSVSGITVRGLSLTGESYHPYKGVQNNTKSGLYQVRYS